MAKQAQILVIVFSVLAIVGFYNLITDYLAVLAAQDEVKNAEKDLSIAVQEEASAQDNYDNVVKYGCANPTVGQGFVMCP
jgi:uncharacterized membrane protein